MTPPSLNGWSKLSNAAVERMAEVGPYGFAVYGVEPKVILHAGVYYDELLMAREL